MNIIHMIIEKVRGIATEKQGDFQNKEIAIIKGKEV